MAIDEGYQGFKNFETWNVVLWLTNDYPLSNVMHGYRTYPHPYASLRHDVAESFGFVQTKDGVSLWDRDLDIPRINETIRES
jgi:hypothetical protein